MLDMGRFEQLRKPSLRGERRLAGIDLDTPRMRRAVEALISLAPRAEGFTRSDLVAKVKGRPGGRCYKKREASYDLSKLRGKGIVEPVPKTRRYRVVGRKVRELATLHIIREKVLKPLHAKAGAGLKKRIKTHTPMDRHYEEIRKDLFSLFEYMNIKTA